MVQKLQKSEAVQTAVQASNVLNQSSDLSLKQKQWLSQEVISWNKQNIITDRQTKEIFDQYDISYALPEKEPVNVIKVLSMIGAIILGLGIILFVAAHWGQISNMIKIIMFTVLTLASLSIAYYFTAIRTDYPHLGKSLFVLSAFIYGATLFLIAQIYHSNANAHWLLLFWGLSILPLTYFFNSLPLYIFNSLIFIVWNFFYYASEKLPNYFYPFIVFLIMIPLVWKKENYYNIITIIAIGIAQLLALFHQQHWVLLVWSIASLIYYFIVKTELKELYLILSVAIQFLWCISFYSVYDKIPNYWFIAVLVLFYYLAFQEKSIATFTLASASVVLWVNLYVAAFAAVFDFKNVSFAAYLLLNLFVCLSLYQIGIYFKQKFAVQWFSNVLRIIGLIGIVITSYLLSFKGFLDDRIVLEKILFEFNPVIIGALFFAVVFLIFLMFSITDKIFSSPESKLEIAMLLGIFLFSLAVLFLSQYSVLDTFLMNCVIFALALALLFYGFETKEAIFFNLGILFFVIFIITRYFDIFWKLLDRSVFFIVGGIVMIIGSIVLEKRRRATIEQMKQGEMQRGK